MTWHDLQTAPPSPIQELQDERLLATGVRLWVKRDDLLATPATHACNGNKWRKLKYNLLHLRAMGETQILSFGGIHANHIAALAAAGRDLQLRTVGIIRGEDRPSPTLDLARDCGMQLHFLSRTAYRQKMAAHLLADYRQKFGNFFVLPEGGSNALALQGCTELAREIQQQLPEPIDYMSVACGTGGTLAGLTLGGGPTTQIMGFSVLKGDFLRAEIEAMLSSAQPPSSVNWQINTDFHFGGYARWTQELIDFIHDFYQRHAIVLDPIYGAKHFFGLFQCIQRGDVKTGSCCVAIHTGGLQGIPAFNKRFGTNLPLA